MSVPCRFWSLSKRPLTPAAIAKPLLPSHLPPNRPAQTDQKSFFHHIQPETPAQSRDLSSTRGRSLGQLPSIAIIRRFGPFRNHLNRKQQTISKEASLAGPGLFSGETATLTFLPAEAGQGITCVREQEGKVATIRALVDNVLKQPRRTCLKNGTLFVQ